MRFNIVRTLLSFVLLPPGMVMAQAAAPQTLALSWFFTLDGSTGIISVIRQGSPVTTQLFYSTCVDTDQPVCQEGTGIIPNAAFQGQVFTTLKASNVLTLYVDTSLPGFTNWQCITPDYNLATCDGGTAPATGGIISVSWVKGSQWARITTSADTLYNFGKAVQGASSGTWSFYATMRGTFMGITANTAGITTGTIALQTGSTTGGATIQTLAQRFAKGRKAQ